MRIYETITMSMLPVLRRRVDEYSKKLGVSRSIFIRKAIQEFLKSRPTKGAFKKEY